MNSSWNVALSDLEVRRHSAASSSMSPAPPIIRVFQLCFLTYIVISVLYTTHYLFFSRLSELLLPSLRLIPGSTWTSHVSPDTSTQYEETETATASLPVDLSDALWPADLSTSDSPLYFSSSALAQELGMDNAARTPIREATFLSKAFAGAMHPTRIIPFYYRASGTVDERDVTITTLVTANRFKVFRQLVERYQGTSACFSFTRSGYMRQKQALFQSPSTFRSPHKHPCLRCRLHTRQSLPFSVYTRYILPLLFSQHMWTYIWRYPRSQPLLGRVHLGLGIRTTMRAAQETRAKARAVDSSMYGVTSRGYLLALSS